MAAVFRAANGNIVHRGWTLMAARFSYIQGPVHFSFQNMHRLAGMKQFRNLQFCTMGTGTKAPAALPLPENWRADRKISVERNYDADLWASHRSIWRFWRHMHIMGRSNIVKKSFLNMSIMLGISGSLTMYNSFTPVESSIIAIPSMPMTLVSTALGLLLVFRTNASYSRFVEARTFWGNIINSSRALIRLTSVHIKPTVPNLAEQMRGMILAFPRALVQHVLPPLECFKAEEGRQVVDLEPLLIGVVSPLNAQAIMDSKHRPFHILKQMTRILEKSNLNPIISERLHVQISNLEAALGGCERISKTPIPTSYTRHTSRFLAFWCTALPFTLWPHCGLGTVPASLLVAFSMLSIEEIGVELEEPFVKMPLWEYVKAIDNAGDLQYDSTVENTNN